MISTSKQKRSNRKRSVGRDATDSTAVTAIAFESDLQWIALAWSETALEGIVFGQPTRQQAEAALLRVHRLPRQACCFIETEDQDEQPKWVRTLVDELQRFAAGEQVDFSAAPLNLDYLTPFGQRVVAACRRIGWGQVKSYGELAARCGAPGAARAVGSVMAKNRYPLVVPCHRVLGASGRLGGYSAPGGLQTKKRLLAMESNCDTRC